MNEINIRRDQLTDIILTDELQREESWTAGAWVQREGVYETMYRSPTLGAMKSLKELQSYANLYGYKIEERLNIDKLRIL